MPDTRWQTVTMDFITDLPTSPRTGNDAVLVFVDKLTKFVHIAPMKKTCTAEEATPLMTSSSMASLNILSRTVILGSLLNSGNHSVIRQAGLEHRYSSAFHSQTDGQTERMNRVIREVLRSFVNVKHDNWEVFIPYVTFAMQKQCKV